MIPISDDNPRYNFPVITLLLILVNVIAFSIGLTYPQEIHDVWSKINNTNPISIGGIFYAAAFMFYHASIPHLVINMIYLYIFGDNVEDILGRGKFLGVYFFSGLLGGISQAFMGYGIGASGAVSGVLAAYIIIFPKKDMTVLFTRFMFLHFVLHKNLRGLCFRVKVWRFIGLWFLLQIMAVWLLSVSGRSATVYFAQFFGFIWGLVITQIYGFSTDFSERKDEVHELIGIKKTKKRKKFVRNIGRSKKLHRKRFEDMEYQIVGQRIYNLLTEKNALSETEIANELKLLPITISRVVEKMEKGGIIRKDKLDKIRLILE